MISTHSTLLDAADWRDQPLPALVPSNSLASKSKSLNPIASANWFTRTAKAIVTPILVVALLLIASPPYSGGGDEF